MSIVNKNAKQNLDLFVGENVILSPNPNKGDCKLVFTQNINVDDIKISINDAAGASVNFKSIKESQNILILNINVSPGAYFITLKNEETEVVKKLIVN